MNLLEEFRNDANGIAILKDWLGDGEVVSQEQADSRAQACLSCPYHRPVKWWEISKTALGESMKALLEFKNNRTSLRLTREDEVFMCSRCGCNLRLKSWIPLKHIAKHTSPDVMQSYPEGVCWIPKELSHEHQ